MAYYGQQHPGWYGPPGYLAQHHYHHNHPYIPGFKEERSCCCVPRSRKRKWLCFWCLVAVVAIGLGVGIGVGLKNSSSSTGSGISPSYPYTPTTPTTVPGVQPPSTPVTPPSGSTPSVSYKIYSGDGSTSQGWPSENEWIDFNTMWSINTPTISSGCSTWSVPDNSSNEIAELKSTILSIASSTGVDPRFILATVMQESKGCVRVPTTFYSVSNPGLMQSHSGSGSCNAGSGGVQNPCPDSEIRQMVKDGTEGTSSGDGLVGCLNMAGGSCAQQVYRAARIYNSGSLPADGNLASQASTSSYCSDIANRLRGWAN